MRARRDEGWWLVTVLLSSAPVQDQVGLIELADPQHHSRRRMPWGTSFYGYQPGVFSKD